jgi:hypothetical protein
MITAYICYIIGTSYELLARHDFRAGSDREAIANARALSSRHAPHGFEVWEGLRHFHEEGARRATRS